MDLSDRLGAWLTSQGCFFRVWAPHATAVTVLIQDGPAWEDGRQIIQRDLLRCGDYWSATVPQAQPGQRYRFRITNENGLILERLDAAAFGVVSSQLTRADPGNHNGSIIVDTNPYPWAPFETPRFEDFIIYQLHIGTFAARSDECGKLIAGFRDVESKLGYVREMGFNCIQPLPIQEFAMDRSWGYNPATFFAPESAYGSPADLMHLVDAAYREGLAVIFDVVYNHAGPDDNVLWDYDGYTQPGWNLYGGRPDHLLGPRAGVVEERGAGLLLPERTDVL